MSRTYRAIRLRYLLGPYGALPFPDTRDTGPGYCREDYAWAKLRKQRIARSDDRRDIQSQLQDWNRAGEDAAITAAMDTMMEGK